MTNKERYYSCTHPDRHGCSGEHCGEKECDFYTPPIHTQIKIKPLHPRFAELDLMPRRMTGGAAGYDLKAAIDGDRLLYVGGRCVIPCGFSIAIPPGFEGQVRPRSGLAAKDGVTVLNAPGTIDSDYRGEVKVILVNHGASPVMIEAGDRIAQLVIARVEPTVMSVADDLPDTERGAGGMGSTGR